jgi:hypothetical protein
MALSFRYLTALLPVAMIAAACSGSGGAPGGASPDGGGGAAGSGGMVGAGAGGSTGIGGGGAGGAGGTAGSTGGAGGVGGAGGGGATAGGSGGSGGDAGGCIGSSLLSAVGKDRLMVGVSLSSDSDPVGTEAPFDLRYVYISGGLFTSPTPCTACGSSCSSSWWGCYNTPPGMYATYFMQAAAATSPPQIPMFTYYELLQTADATFTGFAEGTAEVTQAATSVSLMTRYFNDWRFLLRQIGQTQAFLHIEPDFWGYVRQAGDPTTLAAAVATANPTDCASLPNTIAGMGQCMIKMVRTYAPKAFVGLQASAWNIAGNSTSGVDVTTDATQVAAVLAACGQSSADFVVVETSDRDAGYYQIVEMADKWWDPTDATLPNYQQDLTWIKALTEALGTPALYWQTPLGNANQNNMTNHYQDNRVDYFFGGSAAQVESGTPVTVPSHWSELAASHVIGVAFGAGASGPTTPDTDGGYLVSKTKAYVSGGGQALCQ